MANLPSLCGCYHLEKVGEKLLGLKPMKKTRDEVRRSTQLSDQEHRGLQELERAQESAQVPRHLTLTYRGTERSGEQAGAPDAFGALGLWKEGWPWTTRSKWGKRGKEEGGNEG